MTKQDIIRAASLAAAFAAVLTAGSCASNDTRFESYSADANHPIIAAPAYRSIKLSFATPGAGLMPQEEARFESFVQAYLANGTGSVSISVPHGPGSSQAISYFGERLAKMGVPRSAILVGKRTLTDGDPRVELGYIGYSARTAPCGAWSDASATASNLPMPNFGCATQQNVAAMVANPRDLIAPRPIGPSDATRRSVVMGKYESGQPTSASKTADQSASVTTP